MNHIPSVLNARGRNSAISTERALKQALELIEGLHVDPDDCALEDRVNATIDDLEFMLSCIDRS